MMIVVNHLTRMKGDRICVAGIDLESKQHVRPVAHNLTRELLRSKGGIFQIGGIVELGPGTQVGTPPEVEDRSFNPKLASFKRLVPKDQFLELLKNLSLGTVEEIFGREIERLSHNKCATPEGRGDRSLGVLRAQPPVALTVNSFGSLRLRFSDETDSIEAPVTDLAFYEADNQTVRHELVRKAARQIYQGADIILSLGLARAWKATNDNQRRHWLQVNGIHLLMKE